MQNNNDGCKILSMGKRKRNRRKVAAVKSVVTPVVAKTKYTTVPADVVKNTIDNVMTALRNGDQFHTQAKLGGISVYGPKWNCVRDAIRKNYKNLFHLAKDRGFRQGRVPLVIDKGDLWHIDVNAILAEVMGAKGVVAQSKSNQAPEAAVEALEERVDALSYTKQLEAIRSGMRLLMANATNALFLGGRGGVGKTLQVEKMLSEAGMEDGDGFFKVAGSASAVGVYRALYGARNNGVLFFDDSDTALMDLEARNLFKAAADTKKVRKLSWMKAGKMFVDPADLAEGDAEGDERLPRFFEFTGKIIFISNLPLNRLDPDGALRTRGYVMSVDPTNEEVYEFMDEICNDIVLDVDYHLSREEREEVIAVLRSRKMDPKTANLRSLVRGLNIRAGIAQQGGGEDWEEFVRNFA